MAIRELRLHIPARTPGQGSVRLRGRNIAYANADRIALYRADVRDAVARLWEGRPPIEDHCAITATFLYPRPLEHYTGGNRNRPIRPAFLNAYPRLPDIDKAGRALLDALVAADLIADDRLVARLVLEKRYLLTGNPGTTVSLTWPA